MAELQRRRVPLIGLHEALELYGEPGWPPRRGVRPARSEKMVWQDFEDAIRWLDRALDREEVLRGLLSLLILAVDADSGSIQLLNHSTKELYIAYAEGLSDHTIRSSRRRLGEGVSGRVALSQEGEVIQGQPTVLTERDRSDIESAVCVPLLDGPHVLGVASVSRDHGSNSFSEGDLAIVTRMAQRITPVLSKLLEIQSYHERALIDDLEKGLDRLLQMELSFEASLGMTRDLLEDLSGAETCQLLLLGSQEGLGLRVMRGKEQGGAPAVSRDVDSHAGILGQVLLTNEVVILEERVRPAGIAHSRHYSTLYLPLGSPTSFAVIVTEFEGLAALSHFQRNLSQVRSVVAMRLGTLLGREESRFRMRRLQDIAEELAHIAGMPASLHSEAVCRAYMKCVGARCVAVWTAGKEDASAMTVSEDEDEEKWKLVASGFRSGLSPEDEIRERGKFPDAKSAQNWIAVGRAKGPLLVAFDHLRRTVLDGDSFTEDDLDAASMFLTFVQPEAEEGEVREGTEGTVLQGTTSSPASDSFTTNRLLLREALERELERAQRYHFAFSLTCFQLGLSGVPDEFHSSLQSLVEEAARGTDCVLFIGPGRFAVLAPEEARGQRRLARRYRRLLQQFLEEEMQRGDLEIHMGDARYPHDADTADELLLQAQKSLPSPPD